MPRKPRMYLPNIPCHVVQRGNNRDPSFFNEEDYRFYLDCLQDASRRYEVRVHAYVLMTNHVHLLMTPFKCDSISRTMQSVGRRYVQFVNRQYRRTGTLWEGRHKSSLVDHDNYLLTCMRYIELNPVRAKMVGTPAEYPWTSYGRNAHNEFSDLIRCHEVYEALGVDINERAEAYRALFKHELANRDISLIRKSTSFSMPIGDSRFRTKIEKALGRKLGYPQRGRPSIKS